MDNVARIHDGSTVHVPSVGDYLFYANGPIILRWNGNEYVFKIQDGKVPGYRLILTKDGKMFGSVTLKGKFTHYNGQGIPKDDPLVLAVKYLWENSEDLLPDVEILYRGKKIIKQLEQHFPTRYPKNTQLVVWHHKEHKYYAARYVSKVRGEDRYWVLLLYEQGKSENEPYDIEQAIYKAFPQYTRPK